MFKRVVVAIAFMALAIPLETKASHAFGLDFSLSYQQQSFDQMPYDYQGGYENSPFGGYPGYSPSPWYGGAGMRGKRRCRARRFSRQGFAFSFSAARF